MAEHRTFNIQHSTLKHRASEAARSQSADVNKRKFDLEGRLLDFSSAIIDISEALPKTRSGTHVAGQLLRSGTSPYSNHGEAEAAESPDDFVHKLKICLKELRETRRWLRLVERKLWLANEPLLSTALREVEELIRIFAVSIRTATRNRDSRGERRTADRPDLQTFP